METAADRCRVDDAQAEETDGYLEVTGTDGTGLTGLIGCRRWQNWIQGSLGLVFACPAMRQFVAAQDPADGPYGGQRFDAGFLHLPEDRPGTAEQGLVVKIQADHLDDLLGLRRRAHRVRGMAPGTVIGP